MLKGWDFIQDKMLRHDVNMIEDYSDDINTLLTFVRLQPFLDYLADTCHIE